jgi:hypothetical protein
VFNTITSTTISGTLFAAAQLPLRVSLIPIEGQRSLTTTLSGTGFSSPTSPISLGQRIGTGIDRFAGKIGHIRQYSKALSPAEVLQNFNAVRGRFNI